MRSKNGLLGEAPNIDAKLILGAPEKGAAGAIFVVLMLIPPRIGNEMNDGIFMIPYYPTDFNKMFNVFCEVIEGNVLIIPNQNA